MQQEDIPDSPMVADLREREERFRATTEMAAIGIAQVDADGRFIFANRWLCELLGYTRDELQGMQNRQISHPDDSEITATARRQLWAGEIKSFQVEKRYLHKDGSIVWFKLSVALKRAPAGEPQFDIVVFEDITERKRAEQLLSLEHSVTLCLAEAETASDAVRAIMRVLCENQGWSFGEYWGLDEEASVLRFGGYWDNLGPELRQVFRQAHDANHVFAPGVGLAGKVWQSGEPIWVPDVSADDRMLRKELAHSAGLRGAFLFPVATSGHVLGVFSFWSRAIREPEVRMLEAIRVIGSQIGQFLRRKQAEERTQFLATHDGLTRLPNRELFSELLNVSIESARRYRRQVRRAVHRPGSLQARQRHAGPWGRRPTAVRDLRATESDLARQRRGSAPGWRRVRCPATGGARRR